MFMYIYILKTTLKIYKIVIWVLFISISSISYGCLVSGK